MPLQLETIRLHGWPFSQLGIAYGQGTKLQLEVLYSEYDRIPSPTQLRSAWKARQAKRGVPLLVVVLHDDKAHVCGPSGEDPTVYPNLDVGQVERICQEALEQPSRQAALRTLRDSLGSLEGEGLPGLRNEGFLANHELINRVPDREDWERACNQSRKILQHSGKKLLSALGFTIEPLDNVTDVLRVGDRKTAVAILLTEQETPESGSQRIPGTRSPVSYALNRADEETLDWVVVLHGRKVRLYPVKMDVGVGRRGRTETFLECHTGLISDDRAGYLWLLFSAAALCDDGSLTAILEESKDFAGDLADRLRERIYDEVIPRLAEGLAEVQGLTKPTANQLAETYQMAMRILFRLLFIAYGEDKDLLPYRYNGLYQKRSLKAKAKELLELTNSDNDFGEGDSWWQEVRAIFHAVDKGNPSWGVPTYNGGLFSSVPDESPIGAALEEVNLPDTVFGPALQHLLLVPTAEGVVGPVDFRSLGVREFGTIYEGLLEAELSVADTDLVVETRGKNKDVYRPCTEGEPPDVPAGKIYLHNASGARKSSGSYYTKHFAVEHLLDRALEPALDDHFIRLDELDELEAAEAFFDFRVADIAMGSGHFLVAAVDRIEARFSSYLMKRPLTHVAQELNHLRKAAMEALGEAGDSYPDLEDNALLRRLIARRCIYGVDLNEVAVQLARLAVWIHTFVPGLPLSLLDRNLVHGNSLIGVGRLSELEDRVREEGATLFVANAKDFVGDASEALSRLGRLADANHSEIEKARKAWAEADRATGPAKALCDILTASRIEDTELPFDIVGWEEEKDTVVGSKEHKHALKVLDGMQPLHFPVVFPEVFLRERAGFDVILGNPPWEKVRVEEHGFWARHSPGLQRTLNQRKRETAMSHLRNSRPDLLAALAHEVEAARVLRHVLSKGPFPGMGTGDPDLYKAFCWRFWFLSAQRHGRIGVVLPRAVLATKGAQEFRWAVLKGSSQMEATVVLNNRGWMFEDVHPQFTIALIVINKEEGGNPKVFLWGPYANRDDFERGVRQDGSSFLGEEVLSWNDSASIPLLPSGNSATVFSQLRKSPRLDLDEPEQWRARPHTELHATNDKKDKKTGQVLMDLESEECPAGFWPIYKGESFNLWEPDTGTYYAWADPDTLIPRLQAKRERGFRLKSSVFSKCDPVWCADPRTLPCRHPRIAFRDITQRTNSRTVIVALIPPEVFLAHKAPYLCFSEGNGSDEAFLLGVLGSIPLDWYGRRFVEVNLTFFVLNPFPIPRPDADNPLRKRVIELAGRLACPDDRFADWAKEVGVECGPLEDDEKQEMIHELDAVVAHLYDLKQDHLIHIFESFHVGWDYQARLDATLAHYERWRSKA